MNYGEQTQKLRRDAKKLDDLLRRHGAFRNFVAIVANHKAGVDVAADAYRPGFIFKCEGGVRVNNRDIVLSSGGIYDDYGRHSKNQVEVQATFDALELVAGWVNSADQVGEGLSLALVAFIQGAALNEDKITAKVSGSLHPFGGDPWRDFFGDAWRAEVKKANNEAKAAGKEALYF